MSIHSAAGTQEQVLISASAWLKLIRAFTPRGADFFGLYQALRDATREETLSGEWEPFADRFRDASRLVYRFLVSEQAKNLFSEKTTSMRTLLNRLDNMLKGKTEIPSSANSLIRLIVIDFTELIPVVALDRDIFLAGRKMGGFIPWYFYRVMSAKEETKEQIRKEDPALYEQMQESRQVRKQIDKTIQRNITEFGLEPKQFPLLGRLENIGEDPKTGERFVFTPDGDLKPIDEYITERKQQEKATRHLMRVFPTDLSGMRKYSEEDIDSLTEGDVRYTALTDDKAKASAVTRIYPVKKIDGKDVVVEGRFKGILVEDLINQAGRMLEGVAYDFDPKLGHPVPLESKLPDGSISVRVTREPYVTVSGGRLMLAIPRTKQSKEGAGYTAYRNKVYALSKDVPSMEMIGGSGRSQFYFEAKDFAAIRDALGSIALSTAAMKMIKEYFAELAKHELATQEDNLKHYEMGAIGGFKEGRAFFRSQKQAMAWTESRGNSGVIALGTGLGKTSLSIGIIQKLIRDGKLEGGKKVLFISPPKLVGNLPKEAYHFLEDPKGFLQHVDSMSYGEIVGHLERDPNFGQDYAAIFMDEAHTLKNPNSKTTRALMAIDNPSKICLTASPMNKTPTEVFVLAAITNNEHQNTLEEKIAFNAKLRAFRRRFSEEVGGRTVAIKSDPVTASDFRTWVKQNLYYADKQDAEETRLPGLKKENRVVTMDPGVEDLYRETSGAISEVMRGMAAKWKLRSKDATDPLIEQARIKFRALFERLYKLSNMPDMVVPGAKNPKMEHATDIILSKIGGSGRVVLFTDSPDMATYTVETLSKRFPGKLHAVGLSNRIEIWQDGTAVKSYTAKRYKDASGTIRSAKEWQVVILDTVVKPMPEVLTCTLTKTYALGQNLQAFNTVIHLDRDDWNAEILKQRTARVWRTGQQSNVEEHIIDSVYENPIDDRDETLDRIGAALQELEGEIFERVVIESQSEALGAAFFEMKRLPASFFTLSKKMLELSLSPYLAKAGKEEA